MIASDFVAKKKQIYDAQFNIYVNPGLKKAVHRGSAAVVCKLMWLQELTS